MGSKKIGSFEVGRDIIRKPRNRPLQGLAGAHQIAGGTDTTRTVAVTTPTPMAGTPTTRRQARTVGTEHTPNPTETKTTDLATITIHTVGHMAVATQITIILIQTIGTDFSHSCSFFIQKCDSRSFCYFTTCNSSNLYFPLLYNTLENIAKPFFHPSPATHITPASYTFFELVCFPL